MIRTLRGGAWAGLVLALLCLALPAAARQPDYPALTGRVVDEAGILSDETEAQLTGWLAELETENGKQAVVATIKSLGGLEIEEYGVGLGRTWGIGQKDKDTGVILIVAPNDRQVRFEVGYGLEGEMTDALSRAIIEQQIIPSFRRGDFEGGIVAGTAAMLKILGWQGAPDVAAEPAHGPEPAVFDWIPFIYFGLFFLVVILRTIFGRRGGRGRRGMWGTTSSGWGGGSWSSGSGGWSSGGGFSGGGGSFGGGGASGRW